MSKEDKAFGTTEQELLGRTAADIHMFYDEPFDIVGQLNIDDELVEVPDFRVTKNELFELAKHWIEVDLEQRWFFFQFGQSGDIELALSELANRRLDRIGEMLGPDVLQRASQEVYQDWERKHGSQWRIFREGTPEEWKAVWNETDVAHLPAPGDLQVEPLEPVVSPSNVHSLELGESTTSSSEQWSDPNREEQKRQQRRQKCEMLTRHYSRGVLIGEAFTAQHGDSVSPETLTTLEHSRHRLASLASALGSKRVDEIFEESRLTFDPEKWIQSVVDAHLDPSSHAGPKSDQIH
jgi:hypothetical protein